MLTNWQLEANEFGVAPFELRLANEVNFGVWKILAAAGGRESSRDVRVEQYVLPRFSLATNTGRSWVLVDEEITGRKAIVLITTRVQSFARYTHCTSVCTKGPWATRT